MEHHLEHHGEVGAAGGPPPFPPQGEGPGMPPYHERGPMKRGWRGRGDGGPPNKRPPGGPIPSTLRVLLRSIDAGGIIGKGGENIKRLRKKYDCQVQLPDSNGSPERVLTVIGEQTNCVGVFDEILEKVKIEVRRRDAHTPLEVQILIPQPFMGTIIGTGGTKIKELRKRSSANVKIFSEPMPYSNERSISLSGTEEQIAECVTFFLQEIGQREPKEPIILYDPTLPPDAYYDYPSGSGHYPSSHGHYGGGGGGGGRRGGRGGGRGYYRGGRGGGGGRYGPPGGHYGEGGGGGGNYPSSDTSPGPGAPPPTNGPSGQAPPSQHDSSNQSREGGGGGGQSVVQYPQSSTAGSQTSGQSSYSSSYYSTGYNQSQGTGGQAPPSSVNQGSSGYQQASPIPSGTSYPQQSSYTGYSQTSQTGYGNLSSSQSYGSGSSGSYQGSSNYQQTGSGYQYQYSSQPPSQAPPTGYYSGQYQGGGGPSMFPAAATMTGGAYGNSGVGGSYAGGGVPYTGGGGGLEQTSKQVTIPNEYADAILGPGGTNIQNIRTKSHCSVTMDVHTTDKTQQIITIYGTQANIAIAEDLMKESVRCRHSV